MAASRPNRNRADPTGEALVWVSRIMAVAVMMVLPGLGGQWLDSVLGTGFLALVGFALGIAAGIYYLLAITKSSVSSDGSNEDNEP